MPAAARLDDHFHVGCCCCCCSTSARPSGSFKNVGAAHFPNVGHQSTSSARTRTARCTSLAFPSTLVKELTGGAVSARGRRGTELSAFGCSNCCGIIFHIRGKVHEASTDTEPEPAKNKCHKKRQRQQCNITNWRTARGESMSKPFAWKSSSSANSGSRYCCCCCCNWSRRCGNPGKESGNGDCNCNCCFC